MRAAPVRAGSAQGCGRRVEYERGPDGFKRYGPVPGVGHQRAAGAGVRGPGASGAPEPGQCPSPSSDSQGSDSQGSDSQGRWPAGAPDPRSQAFDRWVVPELGTMYRVALALTRQRAEAEDLVQDSVLRAYQAVDRFDGANPRAWLLTIVRNTHVNRNRRRRPGLLADPERAQRSGAVAPAAEAEVMEAAFDSRVEAALAALPDEQQAVIELVDMAGLSYQQAADALGLPVGTVMSRLHRGRKRVRDRLSGVPLPGLSEREVEG